MTVTDLPPKRTTRPVRVTLDAELIETQERTHLLIFKTGLGDPEFRVTADAVEIAERAA